jgi:hypothetical protein
MGFKWYSACVTSSNPSERKKKLYINFKKASCKYKKIQIQGNSTYFKNSFMAKTKGIVGWGHGLNEKLAEK